MRQIIKIEGMIRFCFFKFIMNDLIRWMIKWPDSMLVDKRMIRVIGRIIHPVVSIKTIGGIKGRGVDLGTMCSLNFIHLFKFKREVGM